MRGLTRRTRHWTRVGLDVRVFCGNCPDVAALTEVTLFETGQRCLVGGATVRFHWR
jgi:hypothetical protein